MANFLLISNSLYIGLSTDTKPSTNVPTGTRAFEIDTGTSFMWNGSIWTEIGEGGGTEEVLVGTSLDTKPTGVPVGTLWMETDTEFMYWYDGAAWKFVAPPIIGTDVVTYSRQKVYDLGGTTNGLHHTTTLSTGPATYNLFPKNPAGLSDNVTSAAYYVFASEYGGDDLSDYDVLQIQAFKLSSTPGEGAARYEIVSFKNLGGFLHPIYIGIQGQNKWIFNTDGTINANGLAISNLKFSTGGTVDANGSIVTNLAAIRGVSTANSSIRPNPNTTDATERSLVLQALDAGADVFNAVLTITPNGAAPRVTIDRDVDQKVITAPANPASGYVRSYPKAIDANNDGVFVKAKVQGAIEEIRAYP